MVNCGEQMRLLSSKRDIRSGKCWRGIAAECIGTILFVMFAAGCQVFRGQLGNNDARYLHYAFGEGLAYATVIWIFGAASGGHFNPAITIGMLFARRISLFKAIAYVIIQVLSAIVGIAIVEGLTPVGNWSKAAASELQKGITEVQAFGVEFLLTFTLAMVMFAAYDYRRYDLKGSGPLAIGIAVMVGNLFGAASSTASMNPAYSLAAAIFTKHWLDQWVFWAGPIPGAILGSLVYDQIFATNASLLRAKAWWSCCHYEPNELREEELDDIKNVNSSNITMSTVTESDGRVIYRL